MNPDQNKPADLQNPNEVPKPQVDTSTIYPNGNPTQNPTPNQTELPESSTSKKYLKTTGFAVMALVIAAIFLVAFDSNVRAKLFPPKNTATPTAGFQSYTIGPGKYALQGTPSIKLMFYKNATMEDTGLVSLPLSGGRLPIEVKIGDLRELKYVGIKPFEAKSCPTAKVGDLFVYSVNIASLNNESANVCRIASVQGGGPYIYSVSFSDDKYGYSLLFTIKNGSTAPAVKSNLDFYTSDIKYILGSVQTTQ